MNNMEYYDEFVLFFGAGTVARPTQGIQWAGTVARPSTPGNCDGRRGGPSDAGHDGIS